MWEALLDPPHCDEGLQPGLFLRTIPTKLVRYVICGRYPRSRCALTWFPGQSQDPALEDRPSRSPSIPKTFLLYGSLSCSSFYGSLSWRRCGGSRPPLAILVPAFARQCIVALRGLRRQGLAKVTGALFESCSSCYSSRMHYYCSSLMSTRDFRRHLEQGFM